MAATAVLSWGKPKITVYKITNGTPAAQGTDLPTPIEDSTELQSEKGDKMEAKIEGGENEAVKYKRNTYTMVFNIRRAANRTLPFKIKDGLVADHYKVKLTPEDAASGAPGFTLNHGVVSVNETWTAADGGIWEITVDATRPDENDEAITWDDDSSSN